MPNTPNKNHLKFLYTEKKSNGNREEDKIINIIQYEWKEVNK